MRDTFAATVALQGPDPRYVFLTGDLGFGALEPVREAFSDRFVNVGVAEQNLIGVAAGIASTGMRVYAYSIASFASLRAVEQVKIDVVNAGLDVCLVGNGGGYGYGHMGPTHHALNDLAVMASVGMQCLVPAFDREVVEAVNTWSGPTYLRLGRDDSDGSQVGPSSDGLTRVLAGQRGHVVALGPLAGLARREFGRRESRDRPSVWSCTRLPLTRLPVDLVDGAPILVFEEHECLGGLGQQLAHMLLLRGHSPMFRHFPALGYPSHRYGSQVFHRAESGLDGPGMVRAWSESL